MQPCAKAAQAIALAELAATRATVRFEVYDRHTGAAVGKPYNSAQRARTRCDKLDNDYGAYRYGVRPV